MKNIYFIILSICVMIYIIYNIRRRKLTIKESFWWVMASLVMLLLSIFPYSIDYVAKKLNIAYPPSLLFVICIIFLLFINFKNSKRIAEQQEKIIELAQHVSLIENKVKNNEK